MDCIDLHMTYELKYCCKHDSGSARWFMIECERSNLQQKKVFNILHIMTGLVAVGVTIKIMCCSSQEGIMLWRADRWSMWSPCSYQSLHFGMEYITWGNEKTGHAEQFLGSNLLTIREIPWKAFVIFIFIFLCQYCVY